MSNELLAILNHYNLTKDYLLTLNSAEELEESVFNNLEEHTLCREFDKYLQLLKDRRDGKLPWYRWKTGKLPKKIRT